MALAPGVRLGAYEVLSLVGRGGMGEVYRARDIQLGRDVALKILPESLVHDRERVARFKREAQVLAALNHPHIMGIYGLGEAMGSLFLVLEFVEGKTLAERLTTGAFTLTETLATARQIAEALQAAHEKGIVHRDLKPANIALTGNDQVKVLDFGLAKAMEYAPPDAETTPIGETREGTILGTAAYMSPEQAKGRNTDKRSDVWAFGCVLYEMFAGRRAFTGDGITDTIAAVLRGEPDWTALPAEVPPPIRTLIKGCLEKDRQQRVADISTALFVIRDPIGTPDVRFTVAQPAPAGSRILDVDELRGRLILSDAQSELVRLKYEVEQYLAAQPHDVDGRMLRDDVARALAARVIAGAPLASAPSAPVRPSRLRYAILGVPVVLLLAIGTYGLLGRRVAGPVDIANEVGQQAAAPADAPPPAALVPPPTAVPPPAPAPTPAPAPRQTQPARATPAQPPVAPAVRQPAPSSILADVTVRQALENGTTLEKSGDLPGALQQFERGRQLDPSGAAAATLTESINRIKARMKTEGTAAFGKAQTWDTLGRDDQAIVQYEIAFRYLPDNDPNKQRAKARLDALRAPN